MEKIVSALAELEEINRNYEISVGDVEKLRQEMLEAKVCTPIIGKFSSGKSALINTILGYSNNVLKEDIAPATAIPAEIMFDGRDESVTIIKKNGSVAAEMSVKEYKSYEADANTDKCARIRLRNSFLKEIPDVMIVDMPGFESGFAEHDKAIDDYLPQSLAYIFAIPAEMTVVPDSLGRILKTLSLYDMPLCVAITKYDKRGVNFETDLESVKRSLRRYIGDKEVRICYTSSFDGNAEEVENYLREIQEQSREIMGKKYGKLLSQMIDSTESYLKTRLSGGQLSESELSEKEDKLQSQMRVLNEKLSIGKTDFELEAAECIEDIKGDVQIALEGETSTFVAMALNNQDIKTQLNSVIRDTTTVSIQKRFVPIMSKYLKKVEKTINAESIDSVPVSFAFNTDSDMNKSLVSNLVAVGVGAVLLLPVVGTIATVVGSLAALLVSKLGADKKREEAKQKIRSKLQGEVYPQAVENVGKGLEAAIMKQIALVNQTVEEELNNQKALLEKALADVRADRNAENQKKLQTEEGIRAALLRLEELKCS